MTKTILSLEQALTLPYATLRFAQLGWRVIRIESPPDPETGRGGDPVSTLQNVAGPRRDHSPAFFIFNNVPFSIIFL